MTNEEKFVLEELSKETPMVISTAYLYAKNYVKYGCDITIAWSTAVEQAATLERVWQQAQAEAYKSLKKDYDAELKADMEAMLDKIRGEIEKRRQRYKPTMYYIEAAREQELSWVLDVIDSYKSESEE